MNRDHTEQWELSAATKPPAEIRLELQALDDLQALGNSPKNTMQITHSRTDA